MFAIIIAVIKATVLFGLIGGIWGIILEVVAKYIDKESWQWWRVKDCIVKAAVGAAVFVIMAFVFGFLKMIFF